MHLKNGFSNASRTQLFNLKTLAWDEKICEMFGIPACALARVCDSDAVYGTTTMEGLFSEPVPDLWCIRRLSCGSVRTGLLKTGHDQGNVRNGFSADDEHWRQADSEQPRRCDFACGGRGGKVDYVLKAT